MIACQWLKRLGATVIGTVGGAARHLCLLRQCLGAAAAELVGRGSLYFTRPSLAHYAATGEDLLNGAKAVFDVIADGLKVEVNQRFALEDAGSAHRALEARETTGSTVLLP